MTPQNPVDVKDIIIVGNVSENAFAMDTSHFFGQLHDVSDVIALKTFENTEFCPRFIAPVSDNEKIGHSLEGTGVVIASSSMHSHSRNDIAMRNMLTARAAKDNGASWVLLVEADLFYSAQDRGPRITQGRTKYPRSAEDLYKFNGQAFSARAYAELLKLAGVDEVMTVHNHSESVQETFKEIFDGYFNNVMPNRLYARYIKESGIVNTGNLVLCAPDKGALDFVLMTREALGVDNVPYIVMDKERHEERQVEMQFNLSASTIQPGGIEGRDIIVMDDMVRSGGTIVRCCNLLKACKPRKIVFLVTHFHSSIEGRQKLAGSAIDEIITTDTIPNILNRDVQGRLRQKMAVLKLSRWLAHHLKKRFGKATGDLSGKWYQEDISSKNPRSGFKY